MNNQGFQNIQKQMSDFFSLNKEIGRMEFLFMQQSLFPYTVSH